MTLMDTLRRDLRFALRGCARRPGFTLLAVLAFALGVGVTTTVFSVVYALLFRPLPVENARGLVSLSTIEEGSLPGSIAFQDYRDYRSMNEVFSDAIAFAPITASLAAEAREPVRILGTMVSGNYFSFLGVEAALGRTFSRREAGAVGNGNVIVLSHAFWERHFGADPDVVGSAVRLNKNQFTIVGVAPRDFPGTITIVSMDAYVPVTAGDLLAPGIEEMLEDRSAPNFRVIARLQPGVSLAEARAAALAHAGRLEKDYPDSHRGLRTLVHPEPMARLEPAAVDFLPPVATVFMVMGGLVLLLASANVANLLLARAVARRKEMAIRVAMGASRLSIVRQLLTESTLLAVVGGLGGVVFAHWAAGLICSVQFATDFPLVFDFGPDSRVLVFALAVAALAGIVAGLAPAFQLRHASIGEDLKDGGRRSAAGAVRARLRSVLVVAQITVSVLLLICAGLFVRSMWNAADMDLGFDLDNHLVLGMDTDLGGLKEAEAKVFYRQLLDRVRSLPGVRSASTSCYLPVGYNNGNQRVWVEGHTTAEDEASLIFYNVVGTDHFATMGTPIVRGRAFTTEDTESSRAVAVVNQRMADVTWPGEDPIGKRFSVEGSKGPFVEVVGVARQSTHLFPGESPLSFFYLSSEQRYRPDRILHVRTAAEPGSAFATIRQEIRSLAPDLPLYDVRTMESHIREGKGLILFQVGSGIVGGIGSIGLILAAIGLYSMLAWAVGQRTYEFGVRMALGASSGRILAQVLRNGLALAAVGIAVGLVGALSFTRLFAHLLVDVSASDPLVFAAISCFLALVAVLASLVPAARATRVDPAAALRSE
jgi:predicted permease